VTTSPAAWLAPRTGQPSASLVQCLLAHCGDIFFRVGHEAPALCTGSQGTSGLFGRRQSDAAHHAGQKQFEKTHVSATIKRLSTLPDAQRTLACAA